MTLIEGNCGMWLGMGHYCELVIQFNEFLGVENYFVCDEIGAALFFRILIFSRFRFFIKQAWDLEV